LILYLEEDLAVSLMWKLLFVPLFHDLSIIGKVLSFIFRILRILTGLFAFAIASVGLLCLAVIWFTLPVGVIWGVWGLWGFVLLLAGIGLFVIHIVIHPHKTIWQINSVNLNSEIWKASLIKKDKLDFQNLLKSREIITFLSLLEVTPDIFSQFQFSNVDEAGKLAFELTKKTGSKYIGPEHFFVAGVKLIPDIENFLYSKTLNLKLFDLCLEFTEKKKNRWRRFYIWDSDFAVHHLKGINRGWLGAPTPVLDLVSDDLTKAASVHNFPDFVGRKIQLLEVINLLSQEGRRNVILVGSAGSGRSALINFLAKQILSGDSPPSLATKRLVKLDTTRLLSGMNTQGELASRVKLIFDEVAFSTNVILVVEEIHNLGIGEAGTSMNLYSLMLPYLESASFQFIATTEESNYTKILEKNESFARLFSKVEIPPSTIDETLEILQDKVIDIERRSKKRFSFLSLVKIVELSHLVHTRVLPDSAISILDQAQTAGDLITSQIVREVVSRTVKIPVLGLGNTDKEKLLNLEGEIHKRLIDQEEAVKAIADSLRRSATGIREEKRPIGSFLFVGPTGVGKTETAKTLADVYFNRGDAFIRFDMSEYQNPESITRLIGGVDGNGLLTQAIKNKQYCLLLLDEFEKADPKILTLFLQVLDDGRLTDGAGETIDFTQTIIIATSNVASLIIAHGLEEGKTLDQIDKQVSDELLQKFSPELINRFDDVVLFKPLSPEDLQKIVKLKLNELQTQMKVQGYLIEFSDEIVVKLAERGFDPVLGARPLRRLVQDTIEANLSKLILEEKIKKGETFKIGPEFVQSD